MTVPTLVNGYHEAPIAVRDFPFKNDSTGGWIVQKYGGTSVGKFPVVIAEQTVRAGLKDNKLAVVCSARSTGKKVEGTTSRLLEIFALLESINNVKDPESVHYETLVNDYERLVQVIQDDHINAAQTYISDVGVRSRLVDEIRNECKEILEFRLAVERWRLEIDARSKDRIVSFGEKLSCRFVAALLQDRGVDSEYVDFADIINFRHSNGLDTEFYNALTQSIAQRLSSCGTRVPVITGFFGPVPGGLIDGQIGRGYTDLCAGLIAVALKANELQILKEVDGIFSADPNKVPTARLIPSITPAEASELTFYGSEVIHHLTLERVMNAEPRIPIRIKNVLNAAGNGTIVIPDPILSSAQPILRPRHSGLSDHRSKPRRPTAVTIKDKISVINVHSNKKAISHGFFAKLFSVLDKHRISVDLISTSEVHVSLAVHSANISTADMQAVREALVQECGEVSILNKMTILSLVGGDMKNMVGIAGRMFATLGEHNINIEMISQGASEINISCVIEAYEATRAMNILHTNLFTFLE